MDTSTDPGLALWLEPGSDPLRGLLRRDGHEPIPFDGMLQLMALIERLHATTTTPRNAP